MISIHLYYFTGFLYDINESIYMFQSKLESLSFFKGLANRSFIPASLHAAIVLASESYNISSLKSTSR